MGIFSRFMDIINSNINALLDQAEDPVKMAKLMMSEMEDTIMEIKANCAEAIGLDSTGKKKADELKAQIERWQKRAELAVSAGRDDLAREALIEKKRLAEELERINEENKRNEEAIEKFNQEIARLEEKLSSARSKYQSMMAEAMKKAQQSKSANDADSKDPNEEHFDRMDDMLNKMKEKKAREEDLEKKFEEFEKQQSVQSELEELKKKMNKNKGGEKE